MPCRELLAALMRETAVLGLVMAALSVMTAAALVLASLSKAATAVVIMAGLTIVGGLATLAMGETRGQGAPDRPAPDTL